MKSIKHCIGFACGILLCVGNISSQIVERINVSLQRDKYINIDSSPNYKLRTLSFNLQSPYLPLIIPKIDTLVKSPLGKILIWDIYGVKNFDGNEFTKFGLSRIMRADGFRYYIDRKRYEEFDGIIEIQYNEEKSHIIVKTDSSYIAQKTFNDLFKKEPDSTLIIFYHHILPRDRYFTMNDDRLHEYNFLVTDNTIYDLNLYLNHKNVIPKVNLDSLLKSHKLISPLLDVKW